MTSWEPAPHSVRNNNNNSEANQQDVHSSCNRKDPRQRIHGVHGGMKNCRSQYTAIRSVIDPGEQDGDKWVEHKPLQ